MFAILVSVNSHAKSEDRGLAEVKCYIELSGREHTVHYYHLPVMLNDEVDTNMLYDIPIMAVGSSKLRQVHKVKECVRTSSYFKTVKARLLEEQQLR